MIRDEQSLDGLRKNRRAELALAMMCQNRVFEVQEQLVGKAVDPTRGLANHVPPHQDMADQAAFLGIFGLDRMILELTQLADVVQDRRRRRSGPRLSGGLSWS